MNWQRIRTIWFVVVWSVVKYSCTHGIASCAEEFVVHCTLIYEHWAIIETWSLLNSSAYCILFWWMRINEFETVLWKCRKKWNPYFINVFIWHTLMNVGHWWWKAIPKASGSLPAPAPRSRHATTIRFFFFFKLIYSSKNTQIATIINCSFYHPRPNPLNSIAIRF